MEELINKRIDLHIQECEGLYTEEEIKTLRPIWYEQIKRDALITISRKLSTPPVIK